MPDKDTLLLLAGFGLFSMALLCLMISLFRHSLGRKSKFVVWALTVLGAAPLAWEITLHGVTREILDGTTLLLAFVAIVFAARQFLDSWHQEERMKRLAENTRDVFQQTQDVAHQTQKVADQMATRFAGFFPENLREINEVVSKAHQTLDVMSDYVGYGHYSAPCQFEQYFRKLMDMPRQGVKVRILVYQRQMAEAMHESQFISSTLKKKEQWEKLTTFCNQYKTSLYSPLWQKIKDCEPKVKGWIEQTADGANPGNSDATELDRELDLLKADFGRLMFDRQVTFLKALLERGIEIKQTEEKLPFFMWCEDGREAVFAFLHETSKEEREVSFRTRDSRLVADSFERKFEYLFHKAHPIKLVEVAGHLEPDWHPAAAAAAAPAA